MKFRDMEIDDIVVINSRSREGFEKELKELANEILIIDLQYSTDIDRVTNQRVYSALALVKKKQGKPKPTPKPSGGQPRG